MADALTTNAALADELQEIEKRRGVAAPSRVAADRAQQHAAKLNLTALCLSGGGIRSAAFCLGVVQSLARAKLLNQFDYLSSVSGGGYISGWLQILLRDEWRYGSRSELKIMTELGAGTPDALRRLRRFTSYLIPQPGLFSADAWAGITLYLRNLILNWMLFLPALLAAQIAAEG